MALLDPGAGKTRRADMWAYARSWHDAVPGVIYEFCLGCGEQYPLAFLNGEDRLGARRWSGTLLTDRYSAYDTVVDLRLYPGRISAACAAHARRNFEELTKDGTSPIGLDALRRFARIDKVEGELKAFSDEQRLAQRQRLARPLWHEMRQWLELARGRRRQREAKAIEYTLGHWAALRGTWRTAPWRWTTTAWNGKSSHGQWDAAPGSSWVVNSQVNGPPSS